jgi:hypothetical protein
MRPTKERIPEVTGFCLKGCKEMNSSDRVIIPELLHYDVVPDDRHLLTSAIYYKSSRCITRRDLCTRH